MSRSVLILTCVASYRCLVDVDSCVAFSANDQCNTSTCVEQCWFPQVLQRRIVRRDEIEVPFVVT